MSTTASEDVAASHDLTALLADWHAQGGHRLEPVRFALVEALARRAAQHQGATRQLLNARVDSLVADLRLRLAGRGVLPGGEGVAPAGVVNAAVPPSRGALGQLADAMADPEAVFAQRPVESTAPERGRRASQRQRLGDTPAVVARKPSVDVPLGTLPSAAGGGAAAQAAAPRELASVQRFRGTWSRLSADERLRQTLAQVPPQAGPLNSLHLLHRALVGMQDIAPDYLQHFVAHVDALLWLEQVHTASLAVPSARSSTRRKPVVRKR